MPYYLKHKEHGYHVAYTPEEVEACRKNGWTPVEEEKPAPVVVQEPKKRGRKPKG